MITSKNPGSASVSRKESARFYTDACCKAGSGALIMYKHGLSRTSICGRWYNMKFRCYNPKYRGYHNYGGRGIKVCDEWLNDVSVYYEHVSSLHNANKDGYTLDRIDNNGNYEPGNLRWASQHTQLANQRKRKPSSGFTGVYIKSNKKAYAAWLMKDGGHIYLGIHNDAITAATARDQYIIDNELWEYPLQILSAANKD